MATLNIGGQRVKVDELFLRMTPEQQNATVEEISRSLGSGQPPASSAGFATRQQRGEDQIAQSDAFMTGAMQGATFGLADEGRALVAAGKPTFATPQQPSESPQERQARELFGNSPAISGVEQAALAVRGMVQGNPQTQQAYDEALKRERQAIADAEAQYPLTTLAGNVAGGLAIPLPAVQGVKGGAAIGAGLGAAYGFGTGEGGLDERLSRAGGGAVIGGAFGAAVPAVIAGGQKIAGAVRGLASPAIGAVNPEAEAARRIAIAMKRDAGSLPNATGLSAAGAEGAPILNIDRGGETIRALARSAANTSPEGRAALNSAIQPRFENQSDRVVDAIRGLSPLGANASRTLEELQAAAAAANKPAYARAYAEGSAGIWNDQLAALAEAPAVQQAIRDATRTGANRAVADGFKPTISPFKTADTGTVSLAGDATPTLQFWDHVKRNLDDAIEGARRSGGNNAARDLGDLKSALVAQLDAAVPSYAKARQGAAAAFGAQDALEAGRKFVTIQGRNEDFMREISRMKPAERELFREGFASELATKFREIGDRRSVLNSAFVTSPASRQRIEMALGKESAARLEAQLHVERIMDEARVAVGGNSTTARQLAEMGLAGGQGAMPQTLMGAAGQVYYALRNKVDGRVSRRVAEMLASSDPKQMERALQMVAKSKAAMSALRSFDARSLRGVAPTLPAPALPIQGMNPSRADSEQEKQR